MNTQSQENQSKEPAARRWLQEELPLLDDGCARAGAANNNEAEASGKEEVVLSTTSNPAPVEGATPGRSEPRTMDQDQNSLPPQTHEQTTPPTTCKGVADAAPVQPVVGSAPQTQVFYVSNLRATQMLTGVLPWDFVPKEPIPSEVRGNKLLRDAWIASLKTEHQAYTFFEGLNPNLRIARNRSDAEGNPAYRCWALVADYDYNVSEDVAERLAKGLPYVPNYVERTLSGNWRFIWLLERPLQFPSHNFATHFLKNFKSFGFDVSLGMVGLDEGAWSAPERLYTNSCDWRRWSDKPIPELVSLGWMVKASAKYQFTEKEFGTAIPLEILKPELEKRYPRFNGWPGEFAIGAQGPSFWVDGSASPKSAIVRETGIQTFASHATKGFYRWAELLGADFCNRFEAEATGRAVKDIYHDGKDFYLQLHDGKWKSFNRDNFRILLRTNRGVLEKRRDGISEIDRCISYILNHQSVDGVGPFCFRPNGAIEVNGRRVLNTSSVRVLTPANGAAVWGKEGQFPWLSHFLENLWSSPDQLEFWRAHTARFYKSGYHFKPCSGQNVYIAGPTGVGKTLLVTGIIAPLMGGEQEATRYLMGEDNFGSELFEAPVWTINDGSIASDSKKHKVYSEMIKRMAANKTFKYHPKFKTPCMVPWSGRVYVTCNADEDSIRMLPDLDISIRDKLMVFKTAAKSAVVFPEDDEIARIVQQELPWLARYLLEYRTPRELIGESRFGVKAYAEPALVEHAQQSSTSAGFAEILANWRDDFFKVNLDKDCWRGTAYELLKSMLADPAAQPIVSKFTVDSVQRKLGTLKNKGHQIESESVNSVCYWTIHPPKPEKGAACGK